MQRYEERLNAAFAVSPLNQTALAERIGKSPGAVSNYLAGDRSPDKQINEAIADALDVPAAWLADGRGPTPRAVRKRELSRLASVGWAARRVPRDGGRSGGNPALFAITPTLQKLIREVLQNSGDVPLGGGPVIVDIRLLGLTGEARTAFLDALRWSTLLKHVKASVQAAENQQVATALTEGLAIDDGGELLVLLVSDYNTTGLTGPETNEGKFANLTRDELFSDKDESSTAGGSYGVGKFVAVAGSAINTVVYLSDLSESEPGTGNTRGRLLARSELVWHPDPHGGKDCAGPMWLGVTEGEGDHPEHAVSHWADDKDLLVSGLRMARRPHSTGTTLAVVGLRDLNADQSRTPSEMLADMRDEVGRSFFPAIEAGALEVNVDYLQLDAAPAGPDPLPGAAAAVRPEQLPLTAPLVRALRANREDTVVDELIDDDDVVRLAVPLEVPARRDATHPAFVHEAVLLIRRAAPEDLDTPEMRETLGRVLLTRGRRMVIKSLDARRSVVGAPPFQAVLLAGQAAGSSQEHTWAEEFLRAAEPPAHNDWRLTETLRLTYKQGAGRRLREFEDGIRTAVHDAVVREVELDADGPRDLSRRFRFGSPRSPDRAPRLIVDERSLLDDGAWEITCTIRVRGDRYRGLRGSPRLVFAGESGKRSTAKWRSITPIRDCEVDDNTVLTIPRGNRSARFRAVSEPDSHPVPSRDGAVTVNFHVEDLSA